MNDNCVLKRQFDLQLGKNSKLVIFLSFHKKFANFIKYFPIFFIFFIIAYLPQEAVRFKTDHALSDIITIIVVIQFFRNRQTVERSVENSYSEMIHRLDIVCPDSNYKK